MRFTLKKKIAVAVVAVAAVAGTSIGAYAYFTSTGAGVGHAAVGSAGSWTISVSAPTGGYLYPGAGTETIGYTVTNSGGGNQYLNAITVTMPTSGGNVWDTTTSAYTTSCAANWFTVTDAAPPLGTYTPALSNPGTVTVTMQDNGGNQNGCQNVTPEVDINAT